jgi:hypothetical protein
VRPEALRLAAGVADPHRVDVRIEWVERAGADSFLHTKAGETTVVARVPASEGQHLQEGATVTLAFGEVCLFGRHDGKAITDNR